MDQDFVSLPPHYRFPIEMTSHRAGQVPWHISVQEWSRHWKWTGGGKDIVVGVADTGIDEDHPELEGRVKASEDFTGSRSGTADKNGHGTHVSSTIVGKTVGAAPNAKVCMAKVLGDNGSGSNRGVAEGIRWLAKRCHIINLSLGGRYPSSDVESALEYAVGRGRLVIAATGNEGAGRVGYPAGFNEFCAAIGAVSQRKWVAEFSNRGPSVDAVQYGVQIYAAIPGGGYQEMSGTSMATPNMAATMANRLSAEAKHLTHIESTSITDDVWKLTHDLGDTGRDDAYGWGLPDLDKMLYEGIEENNGGTEEGVYHRRASVDGKHGWMVFVPDTPSSG